MIGPYVHRIDPVLASVGGVYLWWYGLSYALGFLEIHWFLTRARHRLGLTPQQVYRLSLSIIIGVLLGGRVIEVAFDEWSFYKRHPLLTPAYWLGGMASHGLLIGAVAGVAVFARRHRKSIRAIADTVVIPGAFLLGLGRLGNFIDGQIVGSVTDAWWGVKFPDVDGFRHPVVLYDGAKNLLLIPLLVWIRRRSTRDGTTAAHFVFWYAFLRIPIDLCRDYPTHRLGVPTGQTLNIVMSLLGAALIVRAYRRRRVPDVCVVRGVDTNLPSPWLRLALVALLVFSLTIPSNWTQDVPRRYGYRHAGLQHSALYPTIDTRPPVPRP